MNSRHTTWEVIVAGCVFMALGVYLINPPDLSIPSPELHNQQVQLDPPPTPAKPSASETVMINLKKLKKLEQLQELEHLEKELEQLEKELKSQAPQPNMLSLPSFKILPKFLIYSR